LAAFGIFLSLPFAQARDYKSAKTSTAKNDDVDLLADDRPRVEFAIHTKGQMALVIGNNGTFGTQGESEVDPLSGISVRSCIYPKNTDLTYLWVAALWIGAVIDRDTAVTCGTEDFYDTQEFWPTDYWRFKTEDTWGFEFKSIDPSSQHYALDALSEEDIICEYDDTRDDPNLTGVDHYTNVPHRPLNLKVTQKSMAWSYGYADDFILFDYQIENIGHERLTEVYMGIWIDGDVWHANRGNGPGWVDDIVGFYRTHPSPDGCGFLDTINIAYHADNDGDPSEDGQWYLESTRSAIGVRVVRTPADSLAYSYNWWIIDYSDPNLDWGPRRIGTQEEPFRDFGDFRLGTPSGDRNKYYVLKHDEFDYDLLLAALDHSSDGWLPPHENCLDIADGYDTRNLLSFGPFNIEPGEKLPITFAWIGGENFHVNARDFESFEPYYPTTYYNRLNFSDLAANSRWASWIYDNPGVDTDDDGYRGEYRVCCYDTTYTEGGVVYGACDTTWYKGDGIPDFRGASPPPAPHMWVYPSVGSLRVRFNGLSSETAKDRFSGVSDFEGYRIYISRDDRPTSFSMLASYDLEDYNKFVFDFSRGTFVLLEKPFTWEQLQELYSGLPGIEDFDPLNYPREFPFQHPLFSDSVFYFAPQDFNQSRLGENTPIQKVYPGQAYPSSLIPDECDPDELTEDGFIKYFEYELTIENLLPTVPYYVSVTAFDFGSPEVGLASLETAVLSNVEAAYPLSSVEEVEQENLKVFVYPNPYRSDAHYDQLGFENRDGTESEQRMRRINFANLPRVCKISIYSIDGDLVRELDHNCPEGGPEAMHDTWDLITRNTQAAVSGLYYWIVESDEGTQIGKFVIIK